MTKIVPIVCPGCKNPLYGKSNDSVFLCPNCGTLHARNGKATIIEYDVGDFTRQADGEKVYLPFWKLGVDFSIKYQKVEGGSISKFVGFLRGDSNSGHIDMFLPAFDLSPMRYKDMAGKLTLGQLVYSIGRLDPAIKRERCSVDINMTDEMADFLFVTIEAEKPGTMQQLDYDLKVSSKKMAYLPYYVKNNEFSPGY